MLVGRSGSGTIFFTACNLACVFCQNHEISRLDRGREISPDELYRMIFSLQEAGALNINLVSPTHQAPQIFNVIRRAKAEGLRAPVVYNSGGYENAAFLKELTGLVDIYMPDFKYGDNAAAERFSGVSDYVDRAREAFREMHRQVGNLVLDGPGSTRGWPHGTARRGLLVRHLVLPQGAARSRAVIDFLADEISSGTALNIMDQYHPCYHAADYPELSRRVYRSEVEEVIAYAKARGMNRIL